MTQKTSLQFSWKMEGGFPCDDIVMESAGKT